MTLADLHDFVVRTIPGAAGTFLYALTQVDIVAWVTVFWVVIQIIRFCTDWYRTEKKYQHDQEPPDSGYPEVDG